MPIMSKATRFLNILSYKSSVDIKVKFKNESTLMKILSYLLFFNRQFMTKYITTISDTIYFPTSEMFESDDHSSISIVAHEYVHIMDSHQDKLFKVKYLLPQILAPLMLLWAFLSWWVAIPLFVLFLLPLPAYWRKEYEVRGYKMSLFVEGEWSKNWAKEDRVRYLTALADHYNSQFTSSAYYFMWPFGVSKQLNQMVENIVSDDILGDRTLYEQVRSALEESEE